jgi:hypothetical protein
MKKMRWVMVPLFVAFTAAAAGCSCDEGKNHPEDTDVEDAPAEAEDRIDVPPDVVPDEATDDPAEDETAEDGEAEEEGVEDAADIDGDVEEEEVPPPVCPDAGLLDLAVVTAAGEQVVPKVATSVDGTTWFSWYDNAGGNYDVRIQLLDREGTPVFDPAGILVSDLSSDTWVTDYSLISDADGAAILAFNDMRAGNFDPFAYKVSPSGDMAWFADGVALGPSEGDDFFPKIALAPGGDTVYTWERIDAGDTTSEVILQRLSPTGTTLWGDGLVINGVGSNRAVRPWVASASDNTVIVIWMDTPDIMSYDRTIFARKIDPGGTSVWGTDTDVVDDQDLPFFYDPVLVADDDGGAWVAWIAIIGGALSKSFVQHIDRDGQGTMPGGRLELSTSMSSNQYEPAIAFVATTGELVAAWREDSAGESGIYAQRFTSTGVRGWATTGLELVPLSADLSYMGGIAAVADAAVVFYSKMSFGTVMDLSVHAGLLELTAAPVFSPATLSDVQSAKSHPDVDGDGVCGAWIAWDDMRADAGDIYAGFFGL